MQHLPVVYLRVFYIPRFFWDADSAFVSAYYRDGKIGLSMEDLVRPASKTGQGIIII